MSLVNIGSMYRRLTLQRPSGSSADGYADVATVWGSVQFHTRPGEGESLQGGAPTALGTYRLQIWHRADVRADWRVTDVTDPTNPKTFQISRYGDPDGDGVTLVLFAAEVQ